MGLAAAVGIGAVGSLGGALISSSAASKAADEQAQSAQNALNLQQGMFNTAKGALSPYYTAGASALPTLSSLLKPGQSASELSQMPGFKFQSQWGNLAATNALAAQGLGGSSGPLAKAISDYNNGLAGTYYGTTVNALQNFANMGAGSASSLSGTAANFGNFMGQTTQNIGNAQVAGTLGSANALSGGLTGATGGATNALLLNSLLNGGSLGGGGGIYSLGANLNLPTIGG